MGFPNVDIFLSGKLIERFNELKADPTFIIEDLFDDLSSAEQVEIAEYIQRKNFTDDLRERTDSEVFIFPSYPMFSIPLPQIGISLGNEDTAEKFFDDVVGEATPYPDLPNITHWDVPKGYWASANYQADIVCTTKDEVIWLSRFVQRFIMEELDTMDQIGIKEVAVSLQDTLIKTEHQPTTAFSRTVRISCKVANTWTKRVPVSTYATGTNTALIP